MKQMLRFLLPLSIAALLVGCKLAVIVVEGGEVMSDHSGTCVAGSICIVEVTDTNFQDAFEPLPNAGWYFDSWNSGDRFFCGGSSDPICMLSLQEHKENTAVEEVVASSDMFYLMPVFKEIQPDLIVVDGRTVKVEGREWLQPVDFVNYSYSQVSDVCSDGECSGSLPGSTIDLTGYNWASSEDVRLLFQAYRKVGRTVYGDFELTTTDVYIDYILYAMLSDPPYVEQISPEYFESRIYITAVIGDEVDIAHISQNPNVASGITGVWFWRPAD